MLYHIFLLSRRRLMSYWPRVSLVCLLVVLVSTWICLSYWNVQVVSVPDFSLNNSITMYTYQLLRFPLWNKYDNSFSSVIVLYLLISWMFIWILLLLREIIFFYFFLFLQINLINGSFYLTELTKPIVFLCQHKGFHVVIICLDDILVLVHSKHAGKWAQTFLVYFWSSWAIHKFFSCHNFDSMLLFSRTVFGI